MKKTPMTREAALEMARQESAALLAAIEAETAQFIAEQTADTSLEGVEHQYINEWGQEHTARSGRWIMDLE